MSHPANTLELLAGLTQDRYQALAALWEAHSTAVELDETCDNFACELPSLQAQGITATVLRWWISQGCAEHLLETTHAGKNKRTFKKAPNLRLTAASCFLLTPLGTSLARQLYPDSHLRSHPRHNHRAAGPHFTASTSPTPTWNAEERTLVVGQIIVKRFKVPAASQTLVLSSFQEQNWASHIDDPLPPEPGIVSKKRLHDVIRRLNENQQTELLNFHGDGCGTGIRWRFRAVSVAKLTWD